MTKVQFIAAALNTIAHIEAQLKDADTLEQLWLLERNILDADKASKVTAAVAEAKMLLVQAKMGV